MRALSASEAISPAIDRTKSVLFQPFQKGTSWKLAATAYLAVMGNIFFPSHLAVFGMPHQSGAAGAGFFFIALLVGVVFTIVYLLLFYVGARLQFVRFEFVLTGAKMIAPLWRKYGVCTWRWIGLKAVLSAVFLVVGAAPLFASLRFLVTHMPLPGQPPAPEFMRSFFVAYAGLMIAIFALLLCTSLLNDFVLPPIALENVPVSEGLRRFFELFRREPGQLIAYIFFKIILAIAAVVAMEIAIILLELIVAIPLGIAAFLGWLLLHSMGPVGQILMVAGGIVLILLFVAALFYITVGLCGCFVVFFQAYAIYFLGGRYPMLGDLLMPVPSAPQSTATVIPPDLPPPAPEPAQ
jgi:hypothetical protein